MFTNAQQSPESDVQTFNLCCKSNDIQERSQSHVQISKQFLMSSDVKEGPIVFVIIV